MAYVISSCEVLVTAAPGTGSTSLMTACAAVPDAVDPVAAAPADVDVDPKHATAAQLRALGLIDTGLHVVTATRNPWDFYAAEWFRTRTRWADELDDPDSWVHRVDGVKESIRAATSLEFDDWIVHELGDDHRARRRRRLNDGHVSEADTIIRMESMDDDLESLVPDLARRLGPVPHVNRTERDRSLRDRYSARARRMVGDVHADDIERFGYSF